jgi:light-regulated signal transduction histidine kinase (bacteriophytochrome)
VRPIVRLAGEVKTVTDQDIRHKVAGDGGPRELVELTADIEAMRQRIVDEVSELYRAHELLDKRTHELERSNADLEQFAYIASHDLQEPLRKVASFCQLLQRRYQGRLDERGEQYIAFAVDGAKRMQVLINDLLAFSRVGRKAGELEVVDAADLLGAAMSNLESAIEYAGATISRGALPKVHGEASLLTAVFQNLISNALKFRGEKPPVVRVEAVRDGDNWLFSVTDNGIGIDAEYAERVFVIFQRLHTRSAYPGTGIGLAMCRKIIEYHDGRIWLDTSAPPGHTRFRFTLPALPDSEDPNE